MARLRKDAFVFNTPYPSTDHRPPASRATYASPRPAAQLAGRAPRAPPRPTARCPPEGPVFRDSLALDRRCCFAPRRAERLTRLHAQADVVVVLFGAPEAVAVAEDRDRVEGDRWPFGVLRIGVGVRDAEGDAVAVDHRPTGRRKEHVRHPRHRGGDPP